MFVSEKTECVIVTTEQNGKVTIDREACFWDGETTYVPESGEDKTGKERNATLFHTFYPDASGSFEIRVTIERIDEPLHIWMYQMTKEDEVIKKEEFFPKEMSGELAIEEETAYVLVETETRLQTGKTVMKREIIDWEGETIDSLDENDNEIAAKSASYFSYYPVVDGFFGRAWTYITWLEQSD